MAKMIKNYADLEQNGAYELVHEEYLGDVKTAGIILRHKKSGARICLMANDDENKVFCAAFRTPVYDSTGVPHIIEHTVLNGSKNYPSRDPFMQLMRGSLTTFINAMTYPDKTLYPVASCNDKDFCNLMHVYMDAVFFPNIYRQAFMQEGWHYELDAPEGELKINGIVYSEMQGNLSAPDGAIWDEIMQNLMPNTVYGVNAGGDPAVIPELTYEKYVDFHRRLYHPSNAYIFVCGNCDMDERLRFMDEEYLSHFDAIEPESDIGVPEHNFGKQPKAVEGRYALGEDEDTEGKTYYAFSTLAGPNVNALETRAYSVLSNVLINSDSAPVKKALIKAGIGEDVYGGFERDMIEDMFSVVAKNAKAGDADRFYKTVMDTLRDEVEHGINQKALLAAINRSEFTFREANYDAYPRGLEFVIYILQSWLYDESAPFAYMHTLDDYAELKKLIGTGYYEDIIKKYILESEHSILLSYIPEKGLIGKKEAEMKEKLAAYKASLTKDEIDKIIEDTKMLREYQAKAPTEEEQNCIPSLQRNDIARGTIPLYNRETTVGGCRTVFHDVDTNGIVYANIMFDMGKIPHKYVPYVGLLEYILGRADTAYHSYSDLNIDIKLNTGNLAFSPRNVRIYNTMDEYRPMFGVQMSVMPDKVAYAMDTALEIITTTKFGDAERIRAIIAEIKSDKQRELMADGHALAMSRAVSYFSRSECYNQQLDGLDFYFFIKDILENFDKKSGEIAENLEKCVGYIFDPARMTISLAADAEGVRAVEEELPKLIEGLGAMPHAELGAPEEYVPVNKKEGIMIPSQVQYVSRAGSFFLYGLKYNGAYSVVKNALNNDYIYQNIRVKGGAYGCGCRIVPDNGAVQFYSYRDPKLKETDEVFRSCGDYLRNHKVEETELTKFIIGTMSPHERPLSPYARAARSLGAYLSGLTYDDILRERAEILDITAEQFRTCADIFDAVGGGDYVCAIGNEKTLRDNADMFDNLVSVN